MGVLDVFGTAANFTGIVYNDHLRIGNIIQNAKIEVDEEGTIAAAVTGKLLAIYKISLNILECVDHLINVYSIIEFMVVPLMANTAPVFIANRPFIFAIVDLVTSETLFAGRVMDPSMSNF